MFASSNSTCTIYAACQILITWNSDALVIKRKESSSSEEKIKYIKKYYQLYKVIFPHAFIASALKNSIIHTEQQRISLLNSLFKEIFCTLNNLQKNLLRKINSDSIKKNKVFAQQHGHLKIYLESEINSTESLMYQT